MLLADEGGVAVLSLRDFEFALMPTADDLEEACAQVSTSADPVPTVIKALASRFIGAPLEGVDGVVEGLCQRARRAERPADVRGA